MPFGLKDAGATYQRLVNRIFSKQIGRNMEVYVDDMLVKSEEELTHLDDLKETFATLKQYYMKLNPNKCVFWHSLGEIPRIYGVLEGNRGESREAINNEAEYEGILTGLRLGREFGIKNLVIQSDSKLVIGQARGEYEAKEERMQRYLRLTKNLAQEFEKVEFVQIPRSQNVMADEVSKIASSDERAVEEGLMIEVQKNPSIEEVPTFAIQSSNSWMTPIVSFLQDGHLPQNKEEARKIRKRAAKFIILNDALYKRGFSMPYLRCVDEKEATYILKEIHEGVCGDHAGPRSLTGKII
nr:uncharacterized protein LOC112039814 [Quercus suber]